MCTRDTYRPFLHERHFNAASNFQIGASRGRRMASSGRLVRVSRRWHHHRPLQPVFRYYRRLKMRPVYRNGCIGGAVAPLPRIGCSFQGTANFDLRQARLVLSYFGFRFFSVWAEFEK
jgi:hypothetical protein